MLGNSSSGMLGKSSSAVLMSVEEVVSVQCSAEYHFQVQIRLHFEREACKNEGSTKEGPSIIYVFPFTASRHVLGRSHAHKACSMSFHTPTCTSKKKN
jgi:hypothetical protein